TTVNGFQDDFNGSTLDPNWVVRGSDVFSISNGALHVESAAGDPNHLLYEKSGYDNSVQEVLARIRVSAYGSGDAVRGGVGVAVDPNSSLGVNYLFRNTTGEGQSGNHMSFLDDMVVWGPGQNFVWQPNTWYWVRLRHEPEAASQGGVNDVFGKMWLADGSQAEPAAWQMAWDYTSGYPPVTGFAGITASSGGQFVFDVDYVLIKAAGLPSIVVSPNSFVQIPVTLTTPPQSQSVPELMQATFTAEAKGNPAPSYQWYRGTGVIAGATNSGYTISSAGYTDNGAQFHVVAQNVVSNTAYAVTSSIVSLTVILDTNPPVILGAQALGLSQVQASFSERISPATATNLANYVLSSSGGPVGLTGAVLD
ncbi:MAG: hypothetical protein ACREIC_13415, partial [Limisphaerales bacterium]